eukprot:scaffold1546_cov109-Isochrysis_galbana.AAC.2
MRGWRGGMPPGLVENSRGRGMRSHAAVHRPYIVCRPHRACIGLERWRVMLKDAPSSLSRRRRCTRLDKGTGQRNAGERAGGE